MRVFTSLLSMLLVAGAFALLAAAPAPSTDGGANAPAVSADAGPANAAAAGCPGKMTGAPCCAGCQDGAEVAAPAEKAAGCPCQERARRLREARERARQQ